MILGNFCAFEYMVNQTERDSGFSSENRPKENDRQKAIAIYPL